jgi:parvulin-like peptidyl-prolyl isomerase
MNFWTLLVALLASQAAPAPHARPPGAKEEPGGAPEVASVELRAPLFDEAFARTPVASVDGEPIFLGELTALLEQAHAGADAAGPGARKQDVHRMVDRLVTLRIVAAEARAMGMSELPDVAKALTEQRGLMARGIVKDRATAQVKADPEQVETIYREKARELRIDSVLFKVPEDGEAFRRAVEAGGDWKKLADAAISASKASSGELPEYVRPARLLPAVRGVVEGLKKGEVGKATVLTPQGAAVVRLLDERFPEDPEIRAQAEELSLGARRQVELVAYYQRLLRKLARVDRTLLGKLDFDSARKFEAREKDRRVLVTIGGAEPVRVLDLAAELRKQFFHGATRRADKKEINAKKVAFMDELLFRRLLDREAELQGVTGSPEFQERYGELERSLLFQKFVERVLVPDVDVKESEARARYDGSSASYTTPPMLRLEGVAYRDARSAQAALEKGQRGAEFRWLAENTEGQVGADERNLVLDGRPVSLSGLPSALARALGGAHQGDYRIHVEGDQHWVLHVAGEVPASVRPYQDVRGEIVNALFGERLDAALHEYVDKLRPSHRVEVYVTRIAS